VDVPSVTKSTQKFIQVSRVHSRILPVPALKKVSMLSGTADGRRVGCVVGNKVGCVGTMVGLHLGHIHVSGTPLKVLAPPRLK
jgi:hypothetical protein